jgi:hypothetical protein
VATSWNEVPGKKIWSQNAGRGWRFARIRQELFSFTAKNQTVKKIEHPSMELVQYCQNPSMRRICGFGIVSIEDWAWKRFLWIPYIFSLNRIAIVCSSSPGISWFTID